MLKLIVAFFVILAILGKLEDWGILGWVKRELNGENKKERERQAHITELERKKDSIEVAKGQSFENRIRDMILEIFPGSKVRQNIIIKNGQFSKEIDLVAMTPKAFIVIEAKNYNHCTITGHVKEKNWMCQYNDHEAYSLYNPIFQASSGVWNIKKHVPNISLTKAVVFADTCHLSNEILAHRDVYTLSSFRHALIELSNNKDIYKDTFIEEMDDRLGHIASVSREQHIRNVEKIREMNENACN